MIKNILFDLDGTLIDSAQDVVDCLEKSYENMGIPFKNFDKKSIFGPPLKDMILMISPDIQDEIMNKLIVQFKKLYDTTNYPFTVLIQGAEELLKVCNQKKIRMFIATNKRLVPTKRILKKLDILDYFEDVVAVDSHDGILKSKTDMVNYILEKYNLDLKETAIIGDSEKDILAAHENGIFSVAFMAGYGEEKSLRQSNPSYIIEKLSEVYRIIET